MKTKQTDLELLTNAKHLISAKGSWCKNYFALSAHGAAVRIEDPAACAFCIEGAILRCQRIYLGFPQRIPRSLELVIKRAKARLGIASPYESLRAWNDAKKTTHADILAVLEEAINLVSLNGLT